FDLSPVLDRKIGHHRPRGESRRGDALLEQPRDPGLLDECDHPGVVDVPVQVLVGPAHRHRGGEHTPARLTGDTERAPGVQDELTAHLADSRSVRAARCLAASSSMLTAAGSSTGDEAATSYDTITTRRVQQTSPAASKMVCTIW